MSTLTMKRDIHRLKFFTEKLEDNLRRMAQEFDGLSYLVEFFDKLTFLIGHLEGSKEVDEEAREVMAELKQDMSVVLIATLHLVVRWSYEEIQEKIKTTGFILGRR